MASSSPNLSSNGLHQRYLQLVELILPTLGPRSLKARLRVVKQDRPTQWQPHRGQEVDRKRMVEIDGNMKSCLFVFCSIHSRLTATVPSLHKHPKQQYCFNRPTIVCCSRTPSIRDFVCMSTGLAGTDNHQRPFLQREACHFNFLLDASAKASAIREATVMQSKKLKTTAAHCEWPVRDCRPCSANLAIS